MICSFSHEKRGKVKYVFIFACVPIKRIQKKSQQKCQGILFAVTALSAHTSLYLFSMSCAFHTVSGCGYIIFFGQYEASRIGELPSLAAHAILSAM